MRLQLQVLLFVFVNSDIFSWYQNRKGWDPENNYANGVNNCEDSWKCKKDTTRYWAELLFSLRAKDGQLKQP